MKRPAFGMTPRQVLPDRKARVEERWLCARFPEYARYAFWAWVGKRLTSKQRDIVKSHNETPSVSIACWRKHSPQLKIMWNDITKCTGYTKTPRRISPCSKIRSATLTRSRTKSDGAEAEEGRSDCGPRCGSGYHFATGSPRGR